MKPDKRTLLIIVALALPLVALAILAQNGKPPPGKPPAEVAKEATPRRVPPPPRKARPPQPRQPMTLEQARQRTNRRLDVLEKMTVEEWNAEGERLRPNQRKNRAASLEEARQRTAEWAEKLKTMTEADWQEELKIRKQRNDGALPALKPNTAPDKPLPPIDAKKAQP